LKLIAWIAVRVGQRRFGELCNFVTSMEPPESRLIDDFDSPTRCLIAAVTAAAMCPSGFSAAVEDREQL